MPEHYLATVGDPNRNLIRSSLKKLPFSLYSRSYVRREVHIKGKRRREKIEGRDKGRGETG